jgi:uncharacterized membrane protein YtjA (UPF0391 family)
LRNPDPGPQSGVVSAFPGFPAVASGPAAPAREEAARGLHFSTDRTQTSFVTEGRITMLWWALFFFILALFAAMFGFVGVAGVSFAAAKILFFVFLIVFVISLLAGLARRGTRGI